MLLGKPGVGGVGGALDLWETTEQPGLRNSEIKKQMSLLSV